MSLDRVSEQYYTAAEARAVLGLNEHTFQTWVKTGKIKRTKIPGLGQGVYSKREIDRKAHLIESALFLDTTKDLEFKNASVSEVDAEIHLAHLIYGRRVLRPEAQRARRRLVETNPESTWLLYDREILAASLNIVPLTHEAIEEFKLGKRGWLFEKNVIKQFEPGEVLECIVIDYMTTPAVPPEKRKFYGETLLHEFSNTTLRSWGARGVIIGKLYTCGSTNDGRRLLRKNNVFRELGEPVPGRVIFELDLLSQLEREDNLALTLLHPYRETLSAWREQHPGDYEQAQEEYQRMLKEWQDIHSK